VARQQALERVRVQHYGDSKTRSDICGKLANNDLADGIVQSREPLLVDFWAEWCGPCRALAPSLEELGNEFTGPASIAKLNVDENPESAARYGVRAIPALILFKDGEERELPVGAQPKQSIAALLERCAA
jgi:thioredoxin 1